MLKRGACLVLLLAIGGALLPLSTLHAQDPVYIAPYEETWPNPWAPMQLFVVKKAGREMTGASCTSPVVGNPGDTEDCDIVWAHLHETDMDAQSVQLDIHPIQPTFVYDPAGVGEDNIGIQVMYYVHGVACSGWIGTPFLYTLEIGDPCLDSLPNGIHDISIDVRYSGKNAGTFGTTALASVTSTTVFTLATGQGANVAVGDFVGLFYGASITTSPDAQVVYPREVTAKTGDQITVGVPYPLTPYHAQVLKRHDYTPKSMFLHFNRTGNVNGTSTLVPIMNLNCEYCQAPDNFGEGPSLQYVDSADRNIRTWPLSPDVVPFHKNPINDPIDPDPADLYQEQLAPHTNLFYAIQMWWEEPASSPDAGLVFARGIQSKFDETHFDPNLRVEWGHERLPFTDGGRGVAWMSPYAGGQVDSDGNFWFVEPGNRFGKMSATGHVTTYGGWRVKEGRFPVWITKPLSSIHANMDMVGTWTGSDSTGCAGSEGFKTPLDVAIDPQNAGHFYIVDSGNNCIVKAVTSGSGFAATSTFSIFAGAANGDSGFENGMGTSARFNSPTSAVWDLAGDYLYVSDLSNDAIRRIARDGTVTTIMGQDPGDGRKIDEIVGACTIHPSDYIADTPSAPSLSAIAGGALTSGHTYEVTYAYQDNTAPNYFSPIATFGRVGDESGTDTQAVSGGNLTVRVPVVASSDPSVDAIIIYARDVTAGETTRKYVGSFANTTTNRDLTSNTWSGSFGHLGDYVSASVYGDSNNTYRLLDNRLCSNFTGTNPDNLFPFVVRVGSDGDLYVLDVGYSSIRRVDLGTDTATYVARVTIGSFTSAAQVGWSWMDVDRWGNAGPQDGIYIGCFQCSTLGDSVNFSFPVSQHTNEAFGWVDGNTGRGGYPFGPDCDICPDGLGAAYYSDVPHYLWTVAVDPRGAVYIMGSGEHGITRLRQRVVGDPVPSNLSDYYAGDRSIWLSSHHVEGAGTSPTYMNAPGPSFSLKYGQGAFGYLGFASSQDITSGTSDAAIRAMFGIYDEVWDDTDKKRQVLDFLRTNMRPSVGLDSDPGTPRFRLRFSASTRNLPSWPGGLGQWSQTATGVRSSLVGGDKASESRICAPECVGFAQGLSQLATGVP